MECFTISGKKLLKIDPSEIPSFYTKKFPFRRGGAFPMFALAAPMGIRIFACSAEFSNKCAINVNLNFFSISQKI